MPASTDVQRILGHLLQEKKLKCLGKYDQSHNALVDAVLCIGCSVIPIFAVCYGDAKS